MVDAGTGLFRCRSALAMALGALVFLVLCGCASTVAVRNIPPHALNSADFASEDAPAMGDADPADSLGMHPNPLRDAAVGFLQNASARTTPKATRSGHALAAAAMAWKSLITSSVPSSRWHSNPITAPSAQVYRDALTLFVSENARALAPGRGVFSYETPLGPMTVTPRYAKSRFPVGYFDTLLPADRLAETGFNEHIAQAGLGSPLVAVRERTRARSHEMRFQVPGNDLPVAIGSLARFQPGTAGPTAVDLEFYELNHSPSVTFRGNPVPLAGDFTAPLAVALEGPNDLQVGIHAIFNLDAGFGNDGVYLTEPFDPDRIPVLLLHGLFASPLAWCDVVTDCLKSPEIRENYQFWYGFFSTGMPITPSAALIREHIAAIRKAGDLDGTSRASQNMIVIGHSMGGLIARALATDIGQHYWEALSDKPFARVGMRERDRKAIHSWFFWPPATDIKKVIFLATPHRGTAMANQFFVRLGQSIMELPRSMFEENRRVVAGGAFVPDNDRLRIATKPFTKTFANIRTGIDSLAPGAPLMQILGSAPFVRGATIHSVIGDRGRGDTPNSSDGVVDYASAHLPAAQSECILASTHELQRDPECGLEIRRILLEHLGKRNTPVRPGDFALKE